MLTIPIYNMMLLPDVTFFFRKDALPEGRLTQENVGENILFLMLKDDKEHKELTRDDVYPIGISGKIESIDDGGNVRITAQERVEVQDFEINAGEIEASAVIRPDVDDLSRQEEGEHFNQLKNDLLQFIRGFQWGVWGQRPDSPVEESERDALRPVRIPESDLGREVRDSGDGFPQGPDGEDRAGHL